MTNFNSGDPGSGNTDGVTNFNSDGSANSNAGAGSDQSEKLEFDGRQLTKAEIAAILKRDEHAQAHIKKMEEDAATLRAQLEAAPKVDAAELLKQIKEGLVPKQEANTAAPASAAPTVTEVAAAVQAHLAGEEAKRKQDENFKSVQATLTATYGAQTNDKVKAAAVEHGLTIDQAAALARSNPKLFFKLFPDVKVKTPVVQASGQSNTQAFQQAAGAGGKKLHELTGTKERVNALQARYKELGL